MAPSVEGRLPTDEASIVMLIWSGLGAIVHALRELNYYKMHPLMSTTLCINIVKLVHANWTDGWLMLPADVEGRMRTSLFLSRAQTVPFFFRAAPLGGP